MEMTLQLTIDCADPRRLVAFWCEALGTCPSLRRGDTPRGGIIGRTWGCRKKSCRPVPETARSRSSTLRAGAAGVVPAGSRTKVAKNRVHLDLKVGGGRDVPLAVRTQRVTATVERLTRAGATVLRIMDDPGMEYYAVVLQDPEGNEFCVV